MLASNFDVPPKGKPLFSGFLLNISKIERDF